jgi:hypothetical protein
MDIQLTTRRETLYGGPMCHKQTKRYFVYLKGERIANGETKDEAVKAAKQVLFDAYNNLSRASVVRVAKDGSILVFRWLSADTAMYEFHRDGKTSGCCMGTLTNGNGETFRRLEDYADYVVSNYNA